MRRVVFFQYGQADDRLAAHLDRALVGNGERETVQGERLGGDVLALPAVAARRGAHERAVFIGEAHGQPVKLVFDREYGVGVYLVHARQKGVELVLGDRLVQAEQGRNVRMPRKPLDRLAAHAAGGRIGQNCARLAL